MVMSRRRPSRAFYVGLPSTLPCSSRLQLLRTTAAMLAEVRLSLLIALSSGVLLAGGAGAGMTGQPGAGEALAKRARVCTPR